MMQKIVRCRATDFDSTIEEYENKGYLVSGFSWMECNLEFVIVFRESRNKTKKNKKVYVKDLQEEIEKAMEKIKKNPYVEPTKSPWNPFIYPNKPYEPYIDPGPLKAPWEEPWKMPQIIYCNDTKTNGYKTKQYYITHNYPKFSSKTNGVFSC